MHLENNKLSSESTEQLFLTLLQSDSLKTIEELHLRESCDFSADETCSIFADFIDKATKLSHCGIEEQLSKRKI